jgi:D-aminopeptidase
VPVGEALAPRFREMPRRTHSYGSIIAVLATDAPLTSHQLDRLAKRVALGIGRVGSYAAHGSGEIVISFSTANRVPRRTQKMIYRMKVLLDERMDPMYQAAVECTEEAILNALCMARDMDGVNGNFVPALPLRTVKELIDRSHPKKLVPARPKPPEPSPPAPPAPSGSDGSGGGSPPVL